MGLELRAQTKEGTRRLISVKVEIERKKRMESNADLKRRFDEFVVKDAELGRQVNAVMHGCREVLTRKMKEDEEFGELFQEYHFSGSYYDKLAVGNIRHEFDLNLVFGIPETAYTIRESSEDPNFMCFDVVDPKNETVQLVAERGRISAARMKEILKTALDRALTRLEHSVDVEGLHVRVTRSDTLPLTLKMVPHCDTLPSIEVDMVPVLRLDIARLPKKVRERIGWVQARVGSDEERCLAVALPTVHEDLLEVDFPQVQRQVLDAKRVAARMVVRLLKQERDAVGDPFKKIKSFIIKTAAMQAVLRRPNPEDWCERLLAERNYEVRGILQISLLTDNLPDVFFPSINLMKTRVKDCELKLDVGNYLARTSGTTVSQQHVQRVVDRLNSVLNTHSRFKIVRCCPQMGPLGIVYLALFVDSFNSDEVLRDWEDIVLLQTDAIESKIQKTPRGLGFVIDSIFVALLPIPRALAAFDCAKYLVSSREYRGKKTSIELRKKRNPQLEKMLDNMAEVYNSAVGRMEEEKSNISLNEVQKGIYKAVDKVVNKDQNWKDADPSETHESRDVTIKIPMHGGDREGRAMNISFDLVNVNV